MSNKPNRALMGREVTAVSLAAAVACALASDALASPSSVGPSVGQWELSTRVAKIVERISINAPALAHQIPSDWKIAQWRN